MKNLLIITDRYPSEGVNTSVFVKSQVDAVKHRFEKVIVLALSPSVPRILSRLPFIKPRWKRDSMVRDYSYDNVSVHFLKYFNLPFSFVKQRAGEVCFKKISQIIEGEDIEFSLIHAHFTYPSGYAAAKLKEVTGKPLVITGHGYDVYALPFKNKKWMEKVKYALMFADMITTPSRSNARKMEEIGIPAEKIRVIPNGYDEELFRPIEGARKKLRLPDDKKIILSVGNLEKVKGHIYLVEAMAEVHRQRPDVICYIVGEGSERKRLEKRIRELKLEEVVKLVGAKTHDEIPLWMNACDLFVLPSLRESFGIVLIEAMACGKPVVATVNGGSEEIITDEEIGTLVKAGDAEGLAKAINKAMEKEWDMQYIAKFAERYGWGQASKEILETYEKTYGR